MKLGPYELLGVLGRGGVGTVHRASGPDGAEVAIKLLHHLTPAARARFERERRLLETLGVEAGFVPLLDVGEWRGAPYLVMPLLAGGTLRDRLRLGPLPVAAVEALANALTRAIGAAHERGVVHRDLKPENILFDDQGRPCIADLGIGKLREPGAQSDGLSSTGEARGTIGYMAPEQWTDAKAAGPPADVYALGAVLWECATGRRAFDGDTVHEVAQAQAAGVPPLGRVRPDVPPPLARAIEQAMAHEVAERFPDGRAFEAALRVGARLRWLRAGSLVVPLVLVGLLLALMLRGVTSPGRSGPPPVATERPAVLGEVTSSVGAVSSLPARCAALRRTGPLRLTAFHGTRALVHLRTVGAVAFSADDGMAGSASNDGTIRLWDVQGRRAVRTLAIDLPVLGLVFLAGGRCLSSDLAGTPRLWRIATGQDEGPFTSIGAPVRALSLSADGRRLLTGSDDGRPRLWDAATGQVLLTLEGHSAEVHAVSLAPDGLRALTCSEDGTVRVWDTTDGRLLRELRGHAGRVNGAAFAADGRTAATCGEDRTVRVWDAWTGEERARLEGHTAHVLAVALSRDGSTAVSGGVDATVRVWDLAAGRQRHAFPGHSGMIGAVAISSDARLALSGGTDEEFRMWDLVAGDEVKLMDGGPEAEPYAGHRAKVRALALSPDGERALSAGLDSKVKLWDATNLRLLRTFEEHTNCVTSAAISPDGQLGLTGSFDETARVWDLQSGATRALVGHSGWVEAVAFLTDQRAVTGGRDGTLRVWDSATGAPVSQLQLHSAALLAIAPVPGLAQVVTGSLDRSVCLVDLDRQVVLRRFLQGEPVFAVAVTPDGRRALAASPDGHVRVWDLHADQDVGRLILRRAGGVLPMALLLADGRALLASGHSFPDRLRLGDLDDGVEVDVLELTPLHAGLTALAGEGRGRFLLAGDQRGELLRFDLTLPR